MAPKESILAQVARTCDVAHCSQEHVQINETVLKQRVAEISRDAVEACCKSFRYPCKFDSIEDEITFLALRWLLDFGSGYNLLLVGNVGKTAKEVVQMGVIGMHITSTPTDARGLKQMHQQTIITMFGVDSHQDADCGIPGVQMSRPGPLSPYTRRLCETMTTAGEVLEEEGHASLGSYIISFLKDLKASGKAPSAARLVAELAETLPGFEDKGLVNGSPVIFLRKAQLLAVELYLRFGEENELFKFVDMDEVCADSGNAVVAVLRTWGVLECADSLKKTIESEQDLPSGPDERALRAACVHAVGMMAKESGLPAWQLSRWLSDVFDKDHDMQPHLTKDILAY